jgi:hypothetical protein
VQFIGRSGNEVLFVADSKAVIVDEQTKLVCSVGDADSMVASFIPDGDQTKPESSIPFELAVAATTDLDIKVFSNNDRMYTIPKSVQAEAKRALEWRKEEDRGGTPVGLNTARTLARGGQIGIRKIRHIAKYFPRHEVDKKAKGYRPGEKNYPSNGRIAWALWGGDAAKSWATAIVNRENKKAQANSITASFEYVMSEYKNPDAVDFNSFIEAEVMPEEMAPQFYMRVRLDGSGIDRLYKVNPDGSVFVWDDAMWEDLGNINHDFETYDKSLDGAYDSVEKLHLPIDSRTAVILSGLFEADPFKAVYVSQIEPEESQLFVDEMDGVDWDLVDEVEYDDTAYDEYEEYSEGDDSLTAAGEAPSSGTPTNQDGNYTPEERSQKARGQVRDKMGKFAKAGGKVVIGGNPEYTGTIESVNPESQSVKVKLTNGSFVDVPANTTEAAETFKPMPQVQSAVSTKQLTKNILGEPRTPIDRPAASLTAKLPQLQVNQVQTILNDFSPWAVDLRQAAQTPASSPDAPTELRKTPNAYNDPSLRAFLEKTVVKDGKTSNPNAIWYRPDISKTPVKPSDVEAYKPAKDLKPSPGLTPVPWLTQPAKGFTSSAEAAEVELTPDTSDVPPIYMAIVSPDDPQAVMELVSLVPATNKTTTPMTYKRKPGKWEKDEQILNDLNSPTPPPVIVLDDDNLALVLDQIDSVKPATASISNIDSRIIALMAAGGVDKNKGNAEQLRRYWLYGKGAAKIRWNTAGDWTRCVRQLSKYMGPRSKGYCALRHKEATGMWTGDKEHRQLFGKKGKAKNTFSNDYIIPAEAVISSVIMKARIADAKNRVMTAGASMEEPQMGAQFYIPLVIPEAIESGDGRKFVPGAISMRELPLPFLWQIKTGEGHSGSVVVGKIMKMERVENGIGNAYGYFDTGEYGKEAERLVRGGFIRGVSADLDMFEADEEVNASEKESDGKVGAGKMKITKARVMAVTLVPKPAYQECTIELVDQSGGDQEEEVIQDGVYVEGVNPLDASALVACGIVAGAIPVHPPKEWFDNPGLNKPTALTVTDEGKVFGHIAAWHVDHIGMSFGTRPPRSKSNYAYFHTGVVRTEENSDVPVGQLTLAGGHASLEASASEAVRHYDDTASAIADVHAGEDAYGIWVSGALRPGTTPEQIRSLRASAPSGDWRPIKGSLELVAVCQVNVPGFPIARARVASGQVMALVAAGANVLAQLKHDPLRELNDRIDKLEAPMVAAAHSAKSRIEAMTAAIKAAELSSRIAEAKNADSAYMLQTLEDADTELAVISRKMREKLAGEKKALPDGSFPIRNVSDLRNAVQAYGRSKPGKRGLVRRHIVKRARQLEKTDLIPENWREASDSDSMIASLRDRIAIVESVVAAGGLDRNRGNAERLRRYWTRGEGAAKIRWGTPGDWRRCVRQLAKYMGPRAKGYCQLRHKEATGIYTGDKNNPGNNSSEEFLSTFVTQVTEEDMAMELDQIISEAGPDDNWTPEEEIIVILLDGKDMDEESYASFAAAEITEKDLEGLTDEELDILKKEVKGKKQADAERAKYTPKTQPRDAAGKFRQVLARLKLDLGDTGADVALKKIEQAENLDNAGNYAGAAKAAGDLLGIIDRLDTGALNAESLENVRNSAGELGKVIANLPFAFGQDAQKIRFSDIPPALQQLMEDMITRVEAKIGKDDAAVATKDLSTFMSGGDYYSQSEISSQMAKLLRLLT